MLPSCPEQLGRKQRSKYQRRLSIGSIYFGKGMRLAKRPLISQKWINRALEKHGIVNGKYSLSKLCKRIQNLKIIDKQADRLKKIFTSIIPNNIRTLSLRKQRKPEKIKNESLDTLIDPKDKVEQLEAPKSSEFDLATSLKSVSIDSDGINDMESCSVCLGSKYFDLFFPYRICEHQICISCAVNYILNKINSDGCTRIKCHQCEELLDLSDIKEILFFKSYYDCSVLKDIGELDMIPSYDAARVYTKFENMMLYRTLVLIPNIRFCPAPDCPYAVIAEGFEECPKIDCLIPKCGTSFCYHCKSKWHPGVSCMEQHLATIMDNMNSWSDKDVSEMYDMHKEIVTLFKLKQRSCSRKSLEQCEILESIISSNTVKLCPNCSNAVVKSADGSCNLMHCIICETKFCWLCLKRVNDSHFIKSSGCTYWGKKVWSKKKKFMWRLMIILGGPVWILLGATFMLPFTMMAFPAMASLHMNEALRPKLNNFQRKVTVASLFTVSFLMSPVMYLLIILAGVPFATVYIYGITSAKLGKLSKKWKKKTSFLHNNVKIEKSDMLDFIAHSRMLLKRLEDKVDLNRLDISKVEQLLKESYEKELEYLKTTNDTTKSTKEEVAVDSDEEDEDLPAEDEFYEICSLISEVLSEEAVTYE